MDTPEKQTPKHVATRNGYFVYDQSPGFWRIFDKESNSSVSCWKKTKVIMDGKQHDFEITADDALDLAERKDIPLKISGKECFVFNGGLKSESYKDKNQQDRIGYTIMPATAYPRMINGAMVGYQVYQKTAEGSRCVNVRNSLGEATKINASIAWQLVNEGGALYQGKELVTHGIVNTTYKDKAGQDKVAYTARCYVVGEKNRHDEDTAQSLGDAGEAPSEDGEEVKPAARRSGPRV